MTMTRRKASPSPQALKKKWDFPVRRRNGTPSPQSFEEIKSKNPWNCKLSDIDIGPFTEPEADIITDVILDSKELRQSILDIYTGTLKPLEFLAKFQFMTESIYADLRETEAGGFFCE